MLTVVSLFFSQSNHDNFLSLHFDWLEVNRLCLTKHVVTNSNRVVVKVRNEFGRRRLATGRRSREGNVGIDDLIILWRERLIHGLQPWLGATLAWERAHAVVRGSGAGRQS